LVYSEQLTKETLAGFAEFKIGGQVIHIAKYADDLPLLDKDEMVLQGRINRLIEI
jgi:hypothetical protein